MCVCVRLPERRCFRQEAACAQTTTQGRTFHRTRSNLYPREAQPRQPAPDAPTRLRPPEALAPPPALPVEGSHRPRRRSHATLSSTSPINHPLRPPPPPPPPLPLAHPPPPRLTLPEYNSTPQSGAPPQVTARPPAPRPHSFALRLAGARPPRGAPAPTYIKSYTSTARHQTDDKTLHGIARVQVSASGLTPRTQTYDLRRCAQHLPAKRNRRSLCPAATRPLFALAPSNPLPPKPSFFASR